MLMTRPNTDRSFPHGIDANVLLENIEHAERVRDQKLRVVSDLYDQYRGESDGDDQTRFTPSSHVLEYAWLMVGRVAFRQPRVRVRSKVGAAGRAIADASQFAMNQWIRQALHEVLLRKFALDMQFGMTVGVVRTTRDPKDQAGTQPGGRAWPVLERIPPQRFFIDPLATGHEDARFMGHVWVMPRDELLKLAEEAEEGGDDSWDLDKIRAATADQSAEKLGREHGHGAPDRDEIVGYEVWLPSLTIEDEDREDDGEGEDEDRDEKTPEDGYHGTIVTLLAVPDNGGADKGIDRAELAFIRKPRAYYGPRTGPYIVGGVLDVPNSVYQMGPLAAVYGTLCQLNNTYAKVLADINKYRQGIAVDDAGTGKVKDQLQDAKNDVISITGGADGIDRMVKPFEIGGVTDQQLRALQILQTQLERASGIDSAIRGQVDGDGTATEHAIAERGAESRISMVRRQFELFVEGCLKAVLWHVLSEADFEMEMDEDSVAELGQDATFYGGRIDEEGNEWSPDKLALEIEVGSMERSTDPGRQAMEFAVLDRMIGYAQALRALPEIDAKEFLGRIGDIVNDPKLGELYRAEIADAVRQMQGVPPSPEQPKLEPRLKLPTGGQRGLSPTDNRREPMRTAVAV